MNDQQKSLIKTIVRGGLGNQILQYLAGKYIAEVTHTENHSLDLAWFSQKTSCKYQSQRKPDILEILESFAKNKVDFELQEKTTGKFWPSLSRRNNKTIYIKEELLHSIKTEECSISKALKKIQIARCKDKKIRATLDGFWQNPSPYLSKISHYDKDFKVKRLTPEPLPQNTYISAHIRRGDYVREKSCALEYSSRFSLTQYITLALQILPDYAKSMPLLIATDDPEWCSKWINNINPNKNRRVIISSSASPVDDWIALKNSHINIICNSTFSFTAAMLNTGNIDEKIRCIMPLWYDRRTTVHEKGWSLINGSIDI